MDAISHKRWSNDQLKWFLEAFIEEVNRVGRCGSSLRKESWKIIGEKMLEVHKFRTTQRMLKNQYDYLKHKFVGWSYLRNKTSNLYNQETNMFSQSDEAWEDFYKGHPKAKTLRTTPLPFPELCMALFDGMSATGVNCFAPSQNHARSRVESSGSFTSHVYSLELNDDENLDDDFDEIETPNEPSQSTPSEAPCKPSATPSEASCKPSATPSEAPSRPKKKNKPTIDYQIGLADEITSAIRLLVETKQGQAVDPIDASIEKLDSLGLEMDDPLYLAALDIFAHSEAYPKIWMKLPSEPEQLKNWIARTGARLNLI